jgi:hypothetical protein
MTDTSSMIANLQELLDRYWQLAYAEGRENRQHDTENGDAQECRSAISSSFADLVKMTVFLKLELVKARWDALEAAAKLIDEKIIKGTSAGKILSERQDGNRDGLHYAAAIRALKSGGEND